MASSDHHQQSIELQLTGHISGYITIVMSSQWLCGVLVLLTVSYGVYGQGLSEEEKEELLNAHNHYRGQVDPVATNMLMMVSCEEESSLLERSLCLFCRSGMMIWPILPSSGPVHVRTWRMKIATLSPPHMTTLERA